MTGNRRREKIYKKEDMPLRLSKITYQTVLSFVMYVEKLSRKRESEKPRERVVSLQLFLPPGYPILLNSQPRIMHF